MSDKLKEVDCPPKGLHIVDSPQPEGLPESSRWSESAETTGKVISPDRTPKGCQTSGQRKSLYDE
ncbi:MAG TPA: hypothetical protein VN476_14060, partial [Pyrinomonadaceae bacterium]|nr:hypothetical protein [Pyrinomonadaceae bacterium]